MSEKKPHPFGAILTKYRKQVGMSKYRLADLLGKKTSHVFQLENGRSEPRIYTVFEISIALGVSAEDMIHDLLEEYRKELAAKDGLHSVKSLPTD